MMHLARRALHDPERLVELEQQLDVYMSELMAQADDAGYSNVEMLMALKMGSERRYTALIEDPDTDDEPAD